MFEWIARLGVISLVVLDSGARGVEWLSFLWLLRLLQNWNEQVWPQEMRAEHWQLQPPDAKILFQQYHLPLLLPPCF